MKRETQVVLIITFLFIYGVFTLSGYAHASGDIPDDNLAYPVLFLSDSGTTGSGFYLNTEKMAYFVTARHILFQNASVKIKNGSIGNVKIPNQLGHRIYYDKQNSLLIFAGVMTQNEKDELIKYASSNNHYINAIQELYKNSQKLRLVSTSARLYSHPKKRYKKTELTLQLKKLYDEGQIKYHQSQDVALVKIGYFRNPTGDIKILKLIDGVKEISSGGGIIGIHKNNIKLFNDVLIGNEVFAFGYPSSLSRYPPLNIELPLLRKGIIAGKNELNNILILDCPVYKGNSGGLVIEAEWTSLGQKRYTGIGVVSSIVPFIKEKPEDFENSGYSVAVPMDPVLELMRE